MSTTFVFSSFRSSSFWYCHDISSLNYKRIIINVCLINNIISLTKLLIALYHIIVVISEALDQLVVLLNHSLLAL
ncbi:hypothetical protein CD113_04450 [Staphylococcus simiae]|nr:hypothetical protein CD113_04450 [Staphylococcus simiae]